MNLFKSFKNWLRKKVIIWTTNRLFKIVRAEDLWEERSDGLYLGGNLIDPLQEVQLRDDAQKLLDSVLWEEVLEKPLQYDACRRMFFEGTEDKWDLYLGRVQFNVLKVQKELLQRFATGKKEMPEE